MPRHDIGGGIYICPCPFVRWAVIWCMRRVFFTMGSSLYESWCPRFGLHIQFWLSCIWNLNQVIHLIIIGLTLTYPITFREGAKWFWCLRAWHQIRLFYFRAECKYLDVNTRL